MSKAEMRLRGLFLILLFMVMRKGREDWRGDLEATLLSLIDHFKTREDFRELWEKEKLEKGLEKLEGERQKEEWI